MTTILIGSGSADPADLEQEAREQHQVVGDRDEIGEGERHGSTGARSARSRDAPRPRAAARHARCSRARRRRSNRRAPGAPRCRPALVADELAQERRRHEKAAADDRGERRRGRAPVGRADDAGSTRNAIAATATTSGDHASAITACRRVTRAGGGRSAPVASRQAPCFERCVSTFLASRIERSIPLCPPLVIDIRPARTSDAAATRRRPRGGVARGLFRHHPGADACSA